MNWMRSIGRLSIILLISTSLFFTGSANSVSDSALEAHHYTTADMHLAVDQITATDQNAVPDQIPVVNQVIPADHTSDHVDNMDVISSDEAFPGVNLFKVENTNNHSAYPNILSLATNGELQKLTSGNSQNYTKIVPINSSTFLIFENNHPITLYNNLTATSVQLPFSGHHDVAYNPITKTFLILKNYNYKQDGFTYQYDKLVEYNLTGSIVWTLDTSTFVPIDSYNPEDVAHKRIDITHANSIYWDVENKQILLSLRNQNTVYMIDHPSKQVLWSLGEHGNLTLFDIHGRERSSLFYHAHDVRMIAENKLILFDNDLYNQTDLENQVSRAIEITFNALTANVTWRWSPDEPLFSGIMGSAQHLPNGNRFLLYGSLTNPQAFEVNPEGEIVWQVTIYPTNGSKPRVYHMERMGTSPYITGNRSSRLYSTDQADVGWKVWPMFQASYRINGSYQIYLNDTLVSAKNFTFSPHWQPTTLNYAPGTLPIGRYTVRLVVTEDGFSSTYETLVDVKDYALYRMGKNRVESSNPSSELLWDVWNRGAATLIIRVNDTVEYSQQVDNEIVTLNLSSYQPGIYLINATLIPTNMSAATSDVFQIEVTPPQAPEILSSPLNLNQIWNEEEALVWQVSDVSEVQYEVAVDEESMSSGIVENSKITWLPNLDEGKYIVTITLTDQLGLVTSASYSLVIAPPAIPVLSSMVDTRYQWGVAGTDLRWEVHGGANWVLYRNGSLLASGVITGSELSIPVHWREDFWLLKSYNLTLLVTGSVAVLSTDLVSIYVDASNPYANSFLKSEMRWTINPENALGAPDNKYAFISYDYDYGQIILDMGENESILDGAGADFTVYATGIYQVLGRAIDSNTYIDFGVHTDEDTIDLSDWGLSKVRYLKFAYVTDIYFSLDAVEAMYYEKVKVDGMPLVSADDSMTFYSNESMVQVSWSVSDPNPMNYSIFLDDTLVGSGYWIDQKTISYEFSVQSVPNDFDLQLVVMDVQEFRVSKTVQVHIETIQESSSSSTSKSTFLLTGMLMILIVLALVRTVKLNKYRFRK